VNFHYPWYPTLSLRIAAQFQVIGDLACHERPDDAVLVEDALYMQLVGRSPMLKSSLKMTFEYQS